MDNVSDKSELKMNSNDNEINKSMLESLSINNDPLAKTLSNDLLRTQRDVTLKNSNQNFSLSSSLSTRNRSLNNRIINQKIDVSNIESKYMKITGMSPVFKNYLQKSKKSFLGFETQMVNASKDKDDKNVSILGLST